MKRIYRNVVHLCHESRAFHFMYNILNINKTTQAFHLRILLRSFLKRCYCVLLLLPCHSLFTRDNQQIRKFSIETESVDVDFRCWINAPIVCRPIQNIHELMILVCCSSLFELCFGKCYIIRNINSKCRAKHTYKLTHNRRRTNQMKCHSRSDFFFFSCFFFLHFVWMFKMSAICNLNHKYGIFECWICALPKRFVPKIPINFIRMWRKHVWLLYCLYATLYVVCRTVVC